MLIEGPSKRLFLLLPDVNFLSGLLWLGAASEEERQLLRVTLRRGSSLLAGQSSWQAGMERPLVTRPLSGSLQRWLRFQLELFQWVLELLLDRGRVSVARHVVLRWA